jgi:hypothetical protein
LVRHGGEKRTDVGLLQAGPDTGDCTVYRAKNAQEGDAFAALLYFVGERQPGRDGKFRNVSSAF